MRLTLGISTCPNDTFAFHGLMTGAVDRRGLEIEVELQDVEQLNRRLLAGELDVAKASFHAALLLSDDVVVLPAGSALGYGVGPLLLAARPDTHPSGRGLSAPALVLCPGAHTTATLLYQLFHRGEGELDQAVFSDIMPALSRGDADFGVCIHEGRFTWEQQGLALVEDLGSVWERETGAPLPLGGIVARRRLGDDVLQRVAAVVRESIEYGLTHRDATLPTMRQYAQELSDDVIWSHVDLYVNETTRDLGIEGQRALATLAERARSAGIVKASSRALEVLGQPRPRRLFHMVPAADWKAFKSAPSSRAWRPPSLASQGFIHLSYAEQLAGTLSVHFAAVDEVVLLEVESELGDKLIAEPSRDDQLFPHLYRALEPTEIKSEWPLRRGENGWELPPLDK